MPQPLQPFLHDLVGQVAAPTQVWSSRDGQVSHRPDGRSDVTGLTHADVRVLSGIEVLVDADPGVPVAVRESGSGVVFTALLRGLDAAYADTPDPRVRLDRTRAVSSGRLTEQLVVSSTLDVEVPVVVTVVLTADASPIEAVKEGAPAVGPELGGASWSIGSASVSVTAPDADLNHEGSTLTLRWEVTLPVRGQVALDWWVEVVDPHAVVVSAPPDPLLETALLGPDLDPRLDAWLERSLADLAGLAVALPEHPGDVFYAAGAPWYLTLFGRDSLWAARMALPLGAGALETARGTLRTLARLQGRADDPRTGEQPGKIAHELRRTAYELGGMSLPPLYYGTVDATPLWVCLLHDAWRAGLADDDVAALLPALEAALGWLTAETAHGDGFLRYLDAGSHGLANQGWKDSRDAVRFADGRLASGSIALCEVQGYAYEAATWGAALLEGFDRPGADDLRGWAGGLQDRFRASFWCGLDSTAAGAFPALALDGDGARVDSLTSNIGHLLGTGLLNLEEEWRVAQHLTSPELDSGLGLRTMATTDAGYAPLSYHCGSVWPHDTAIAIDGLHRAGLGEQAGGLVEGLLEAARAYDYRLPELWSGEGAPVPYPAACRPQAWSAAAAVVVARHAGAFGG